MTGGALALVLGAALLHATWNAILKGGSGNRAVALAGISAAHAMVGIVMVLIFPAPHPDSWFALFVSTVVHYAYYALLYQGYRLGDLSLVYPIARGAAPLLVAVAAVVVIGEVLSPMGWLGLFTICGGIALLTLQSWNGRASRTAIWVAAALGLAIGVYSAADGIGIRASASPMGYMGWLFLLEFPVPLAIALVRIRTGRVIERRAIKFGLIGGFLSVTSYAMVLYANTLAPLGAVSAIRESSVIIAALIGVVLFRERPIGGRLLAAAIVAGGVILLAGS
jgi:drug/metabolite transporter (DMT)-like permease